MLDPEVVKAFFSKIQKDPYDLDTRKVYADYLDDTGIDSDMDEAIIQRAWTKEKQDAIESIKEYAENVNSEVRSWYDDEDHKQSKLTYEDLIKAADNYLDNDDYLYFGSSSYPELDDQFWDWYELATGKSVDLSKRHSFFACSC